MNRVSQSAMRPTRIRSFILALGLAGVCLIGTGCTDVSRNGEDLTAKFALWVPLVFSLVGLAIAPLGWLLRKKSARFGYGMLIGGPLLLLVVVPMFLNDRVTLEGDRFELRTGFWFAPTVRDIDLTTVQSIEVLIETKRKRRGSSEEATLLFYDQDGGPVEVPVGTLMDEVYEDLLIGFESRGIPIQVNDQR